MTVIRARAARLLERELRAGDLALTFDESVASTSEVHVGGGNFFPTMLEDIRTAASSVHINQFGFKEGAIGGRFLEALLAKASEGVHVRLIVDGQGSRPDGSSRGLYDRLASGGVDVRVVRATRLRAPSRLRRPGVSSRWNFDRLMRIDHRKFAVIDGRIGWVGGAGVEDHFQDGRFHDLFLRLSGPVTSQLQLVFLASFHWLGGEIAQEQLEVLFPGQEIGEWSAPAIVLHNGPAGCRPITTAIAELIDSARETLDVVNPYVTDRRMILRIEQAARRGVSVRLFVPSKPNNWLCGTAQRSHHEALLEAGVRILEHPSMLHAKAFVRDREDVLIGTCNLDAWSLERFFEIDVRVRSRVLAEQFEERFSAPAESVSSPGRAPAGTRERLVARAVSAVSPLL